MELYLNKDFVLIDVACQEVVRVMNRLISQEQPGLTQDATFLFSKLNLIKFVFDQEDCGVVFGTAPFLDGGAAFLIPINSERFEWFIDDKKSKEFLYRILSGSMGGTSKICVSLDDVWYCNRPRKLEEFIEQTDVNFVEVGMAIREAVMDKIYSVVKEEEEKAEEEAELEALSELLEDEETEEEEEEEDGEDEEGEIEDFPFSYDPEQVEMKPQEEVIQQEQKKKAEKRQECVRKHGNVFLVSNSLDNLCNYCTMFSSYDGQSSAFKLDGKYYLILDHLTRKMERYLGEFDIEYFRAREWWNSMGREPLIEEGAIGKLAIVGGGTSCNKH